GETLGQRSRVELREDGVAEELRRGAGIAVLGVQAVELGPREMAWAHGRVDQLAGGAEALAGQAGHQLAGETVAVLQVRRNRAGPDVDQGVSAATLTVTDLGTCVVSIGERRGGCERAMRVDHAVAGTKCEGDSGGGSDVERAHDNSEGQRDEAQSR